MIKERMMNRKIARVHNITAGFSSSGHGMEPPDRKDSTLDYAQFSGMLQCP